MSKSNRYINQPDLGMVTSSGDVPQHKMPGYIPVTFLFGTLAASSSVCVLDSANTADSVKYVETYIELSKSFNNNKEIYYNIATLFNVKARNVQYQKAMNEIREMILSSNALTNNWDGFGAVPVGVQSANMAIALLDFLSPAAIKLIDDCFPESNGTVSLKWKNEYAERVSVNIGSSGMSYYVKLLGKETEYFNSIEVNEQSGNILSQKIESIICA